jgi:hypothetical protein
MPERQTATASAAERVAILVRIDELLADPSAVHLIDHYLDRLLPADRND